MTSDSFSEFSLPSHLKSDRTFSTIEAQAASLLSTTKLLSLFASSYEDAVIKTTSAASEFVDLRTTTPAQRKIRAPHLAALNATTAKSAPYDRNGTVPANQGYQVLNT